MGWLTFFSVRKKKRIIHVQYDNGYATTETGEKFKTSRPNGFAKFEVEDFNLRSLFLGWSNQRLLSFVQSDDNYINRCDGTVSKLRQPLDHVACWDRTGHARHTLPAAEVLASRIASPADFVSRSGNGNYHLVRYDTKLRLGEIPPLSLIGDGKTRIDTAMAVAVDPLTMISSHSIYQEAFAQFADPVCQAAINSIDWAGLALPVALSSALQAMVAAGLQVGDVLAGALSPGGVPFLEPALRLYAYYTQEVDPAHDSAREYVGSTKHFTYPPMPPERAQQLAALRAFNVFGGRNQRTAIDPAVFNAKNALKSFSDDSAGQRAIMNVATAQALEIANGDNKPFLDLGTDVSEITAGLIARRFPEFKTRMTSKRHVHGVSQAVRYAFMNIVHDRLLNSPDLRLVHFIGGMPGQIARFGHVVHNCAPFMTGRDDFRVHEMCSNADRDHFAKCSENHRFETCQHSFDNAVVVAPYSVADIHVRDFIRSMIRTGSKSAYVMANIPVPMLDRRVTTYRDEWLGVQYERRGDTINMYHLGGASAGYANDAEKMMSWCSPLPVFQGFHVQVEEIRRFGTSFLLHVGVGLGKQEITPTMWRVTDEKFYLLPLLVPSWREPEQRFFVVPKKRFEAVVEFAMAPGTSKDLGEVLATKVRGQQAEIKIGGHVIEPRWEMDIDEFNSVIGHAMVAAEARAHDRGFMLHRLRAYMFQNYAAHGLWGVWGRALMYAYRLFTFQLTGNRSPFLPTWLDRVQSWLFASAFDRKQFEAYYNAVGEYRVISGKEVISLPSIVDDFAQLAKFLRASGQKIASKWEFWHEDFAGYFYCGSPNDERYPVPKHVPTPTMSEIDPADIELPEDDDLGEYDEPKDPEEKRHYDEARVPTPDTTSEPDVEMRPDQTRADRPVAEGPAEVLPLYYESGSAEDNLFTVSMIDDQLYTPSVFDPFGALVRQTPSSIASAKFFDTYEPTTDFTAVDEWIPCPDSGLAHIIDFAGKKFPSRFDKLSDTMIAAMLRVTNFDQTEPQMVEHVSKFYDYVSALSPDPVDPVLVIDGVAASAKSSVVREYLKRNRIYDALIVTPSRRLRSEWQDAGDHYRVCTQHSINAVRDFVPSIIVLDEVFALDMRVYLAWSVIAASLGAHVWAIGERNQKYQGAGAVPLDWIDDSTAIKIQMPVSNAMPLDVTTCARNLVGDVGPFQMIQTRSTQRRSIVIADPVTAKGKCAPPSSIRQLLFVGRSSDVRLDVGFDHVTAPSVSQIQGARCDESLFLPSEKSRVVDWLANNKNQLYIALSRHRKKMYFVMSPDVVRQLLGDPLEQYVIVRGNYGKKPGNEPPHMLDALEVDVDVRVPETAPLNLADHVTQVTRIERVNKLPMDWTPELETSAIVTLGEVAELTARFTQHDAIFDHAHALDMSLAKAGTLHSLGEFEIKVGSIARSTIPDVDKLAIHQRADNTFDDLRNVALRQTDVEQRSVGPGQLINEVDEALKRFKRAYMKDEFVTYAPTRDVATWLSSRTAAYMADFIRSQTVYGEEGSTTRHKGFLKTQDKVKPESGFTSTWTHGQTVIASDHTYNAEMGPLFRNLIPRLQDRLRDDVVIDVGYSDRDLARLLRENGMLSQFSESNVQIDISRQDSSHSAVSLGVFCALLLECGYDDSDVLHYFKRREQYSFRSLHPGLYRGTLRFNLPSGDPLTLICNVIQGMTTTAERFDVTGRASVHKGDDEIFSGPELRANAAFPIMSLRDVKLKIFSDLPPYHAGRFFTEEDVLIDPVRRFMKHFARSHNEKVTNDELHMAVLDWGFRFTEYNYRYLLEAASRFYPDFSRQDVDVMIRCVAKLRDRKFFDMTYPLRADILAPGVIEFQSDCALRLYTLLFGPPREELAATLRNGTQSDITRVFRMKFKGRVYEHHGKVDRRLAPPGIHVERDHVMLVVDPINGKRVSVGWKQNLLSTTRSGYKHSSAIVNNKLT